MVVRANHYNAGNALVQQLHPKALRSQGHCGLLSFTKIFVPDQSQLDLSLLVKCRPISILHRGLLQASDWMGASPFTGSTSSCKMNKDAG
jgi:hypothetical protein